MGRLVVETGADAGRIFALTGDLMVVGRALPNDVVLNDSSVSRLHAHVLRRADGYYLRDVGSKLGTFVNGARLTGDVPLHNGDRVTIGQTELVFDSEEPEEPRPSPPRTLLDHGRLLFDQDGTSPPLDKNTIMLSLSAGPGALERELSVLRVQMLSRVAEAMRSVSDLEELLGRLLEAIRSLFHPDRSAVLLRESPEGKLVPKVMRPEQSELVVSRSIVDYAIEHQMSVLVGDAAGDVRFSGSASIQGQAIRAAVCCPLISKDRVLGALYLDAQVNLLTYQEEDLALLNVIAANAAIAIENAILIREKREATRLAESEREPILAESASMQRVQDRIAELARSTAPVLITGEPGTGKFVAAQAIHLAAGGPDAPFVHLDCASFVGREAREALFGSAGAEALPGTAPSSDRTDGPDGGAFRLADQGTLVLRHVGGLDARSQEVLCGFLESQADGAEIRPRTRVIATTSEDLGSLARSGRFHAPLRERLSGHTLEMPRLVDRKEDVLPLARYFLAKCGERAHECAPSINKSAQHVLGRLRWRRRNVAELREAIELAAVIVDGPEIGAEHIFTGPKGKSLDSQWDLAPSRLVRWLLRPLVSNVLEIAVLLFFAALTLVCLAAGDLPAGRIANGLVWGLWWPGLLVLFLFVGRLWCPFCPIAKAGRIARAILSFNLPPPSWLKRLSGWIMAILFFAIIWSEHVFQMHRTPVATGCLLVSLMALSVVLCTVYAREVWCRYVCPLGSLSAGYAVSSPVQVHANPNICASECKTHECYKGSPCEAGCPVFHHPLFVRDSHFCKVCLTCVRVCPNQSARVYLRPPLQDIWRMEDLSATLVPFSMVAFFLSIIMLASGKEGPGLGGAWAFTAASCLAVAAALVTSAALPRLLSRQRDPTVASRVAFALLLLAWGPLMAFHLGNVPGLDALRIQFEAGSFWAERFPSLDVPLLAVLQLAGVFLAATLAGVAFWRIAVHAGGQGAQVIPWGWRAVLATGAIYLAVAVLLVFLGEAP